MSDSGSDNWRELAVFADRASAEVLAGLLRSGSIDVRVVADEPVPGLLRSCTVFVSARQWMRARDMYSQAQLSEEEWARYMHSAEADEKERKE